MYNTMVTVNLITTVMRLKFCTLMISYDQHVVLFLLWTEKKYNVKSIESRILKNYKVICLFITIFKNIWHKFKEMILLIIILIVPNMMISKGYALPMLKFYCYLIIHQTAAFIFLNMYKIFIIFSSTEYSI